MDHTIFCLHISGETINKQTSKAEASYGEVYILNVVVSLENIDTNVDIDRACETIKENLNR
jgi:hypothetical protein